VISSWAAAAPDQALGWINQLQDADLRSEMTSRTLGTWAADEPTLALQYANAIQLPDQRATMQEQILSTWASAAPDQLAAWINQNPNLQSTDTARQHLTGAWTESRPETALNVAAGIRQPELRLEMMETVLSDWQEKNPRAVADYVRRHPQIAPLLEQ
jgi:hypothetical protein